MATLTQYLDYYQSLMAYQYRGLPRASETIRNYVAQAVAGNFLETLNTAFNLETAVGPQLDTIGKYVGVGRQTAVPIDTPYFGFWDYTETIPANQNPNGFYDYALGPSGSAEPYNVPLDTTQTISAPTLFFSAQIDGELLVDEPFIQSQFVYAEFYSYLNSSSSSTTLSDGQYRFLIKLQISLNYSDNTLYTIQQYLAQYFPGQITVIDNKDMTLVYTVSTAVPLPIDIIKNYLPKPMGVGLTAISL
jgi:hypothetical protein